MILKQTVNPNQNARTRKTTKLMFMQFTKNPTQTLTLTVTLNDNLLLLSTLSKHCC